MSLFGKLGLAVLVLGGVFAAAGWFASAPRKLDAETVAALGAGDAVKGERMFNAGGCASCHAAPNADAAAGPQLAGGVKLTTQFGTFVAPNISSDPTDGIGAWTVEDLANAMLKGVSPSGRHYYPAFPYASYARMAPADVADLHAYLQTTPAVEGRAPDHSLDFPFTIRRGIGLWKLLYLSDQPVIALEENAPPELALGRYLVEGPGHCGECHTPRDIFGGTKNDEWLAGAAAAEGDGIVPNITAGEGGIEWSQADLEAYFETGFTPDFDTVGGSMTAVQKNLAKLTPEDRAAIAAYIKAVPPHPNGYPAREPQAAE